MATIYVIHKNTIFDAPLGFTTEPSADAAIASLAKTETNWIKRPCQLFSDQATFDTVYKDFMKQRALAKLTDEEKKILGL